MITTMAWFTSYKCNKAGDRAVYKGGLEVLITTNAKVMVRNKNLKTVFNYFPEIFFAFDKMLPDEVVRIYSIQILVSPGGEHRFILFQ